MIQLLLLPGLGGDHRMVHSQLSLPYTLITPDYIPFARGETLAEYAKRFCEHLNSTHAIDLNQPIFIAGYSLGSAIGQEFTKYISVRGLILIGGLVSSDELRFIPRIFGRYICRWLPLWVYRASEIFVVPIMRMISGIPKSETALAGEMYRDLARGMFRDAYYAISRWRGENVALPMLRIHGAFDHIIRCPKPSPSVVIIPNAKHLVGQSYPSDVNEAIEAFISRMINDYQ